MSQNPIYVVGDIHGCLDLLTAALARIERHLKGRRGRVVLLGDYVDRGPDSRGVLERVMRAQKEGAVCLKGNHEDMMVRSCRGDPKEMTRWLSVGGDATMRSYGGTGLADATVNLVPEDHLRWMETRPMIAVDDYRVYVHAGIMPGFGVEEQEEGALLWIRDKFLRASEADFPDPVHIVHGHTPFWEEKQQPNLPELLAHRTNLDTGAYATGVLSIGVFDAHLAGGPLEVLTVTR